MTSLTRINPQFSKIPVPLLSPTVGYVYDAMLKASFQSLTQQRLTRSFYICQSRCQSEELGSNFSAQSVLKRLLSHIFMCQNSGLLAKTAPNVYGELHECFGVDRSRFLSAGEPVKVSPPWHLAAHQCAGSMVVLVELQAATQSGKNFQKAPRCSLDSG